MALVWEQTNQLINRQKPQTAVQVLISHFHKNNVVHMLLLRTQKRYALSDSSGDLHVERSNFLPAVTNYMYVSRGTEYEASKNTSGRYGEGCVWYLLHIGSIVEKHFSFNFKNGITASKEDMSALWTKEELDKQWLGGVSTSPTPSPPGQLIPSMSIIPPGWQGHWVRHERSLATMRLNCCPRRTKSSRDCDEHDDVQPLSAVQFWTRGSILRVTVWVSGGGAWRQWHGVIALPQLFKQLLQHIRVLGIDQVELLREEHHVVDQGVEVRVQL